MRAVLVLAFALVSTAALAHTGHSDNAGLVHGFMHPLGGIDHVLAMVAVGVLASVLGGRALYLVPLSFILMLTIGFTLGIANTGLPFIELGIALSSVVIGGAAALGRPLPTLAAMALAGAFAVFHGVAHGTEMPAGSASLDYVLGFVAATTLLHAAGIAGATIVARLVGRHGQHAARLTGGVVALAGTGIVAGWL